MNRLTGRGGLRAAAVLTLVFAFACGQSPTTPSSIDTTIDTTAETATPIPTAEGTLAPLPSESQSAAPALAHVEQETVTYSPPPPPAPTPKPDPQLWRFEGVVVDGQGKPLEGVCIAVGPHGCRPSSVRTDKRGVWFIDFPQAPVQYDLHFMKSGFKVFDVRVTPTSPWTLDVVLKP